MGPRDVISLSLSSPRSARRRGAVDAVDAGRAHGGQSAAWSRLRKGGYEERTLVGWALRAAPGLNE